VIVVCPLLFPLFLDLKSLNEFNFHFQYQRSHGFTYSGPHALTLTWTGPLGIYK
jgi:hypothetical protein